MRGTPAGWVGMQPHPPTLEQVVWKKEPLCRDPVSFPPSVLLTVQTQCFPYDLLERVPWPSTLGTAARTPLATHSRCTPVLQNLRAGAAPLPAHGVCGRTGWPPSLLLPCTARAPEAPPGSWACTATVAWPTQNASHRAPACSRSVAGPGRQRLVPAHLHAQCLPPASAKLSSLGSHAHSGLFPVLGGWPRREGLQGQCEQEPRQVWASSTRELPGCRCRQHAPCCCSARSGPHARAPGIPPGTRQGCDSGCAPWVGGGWLPSRQVCARRRGRAWQ